LNDPLRPVHLADIVGQHSVTQPLSVAIKAAIQRNEPLSHVLFYGPPGLGKTSLANTIAAEMNSPLVITSGPAISSQRDILALINSLQPNSVLFIDEVHRLKQNLEEVFYPILEDNQMHVMLGKPPRPIILPLQPVTIVAATTRFGAISQPLRDRFQHVYHLASYSIEELSTIIERSAVKLNLDITKSAITAIAQRSRGTPRWANHYLYHARDYASITKSAKITIAATNRTFSSLHVDPIGLLPQDYQYLDALNTTFKGGPVGLATITSVLQSDEATVHDTIEPYLITNLLIQRVPQGRILTQAGRKYLMKQTHFSKVA
jgi:Holliday junction DNA helicase RuvB